MRHNSFYVTIGIKMYFEILRITGKGRIYCHPCLPLHFRRNYMSHRIVYLVQRPVDAQSNGPTDIRIKHYTAGGLTPPAVGVLSSTFPPHAPFPLSSVTVKLATYRFV